MRATCAHARSAASSTSEVPPVLFLLRLAFLTSAMLRRETTKFDPTSKVRSCRRQVGHVSSMQESAARARMPNVGIIIYA